MNRRFYVWVALLSIVGLLAGLDLSVRLPRPTRAAATLTVEVTSKGDSVAASESVCPDSSKCTLRRAIEMANADTGADPFTITFNAQLFPAVTPATIAVEATPLPAISRAGVTVDATGAGVQVDGSQLPATANGLVLSGAQAVVRGLSIHNFGGICLDVQGVDATVGGDSSLGQGNTMGNCGTGLAISGAGATVTGNRIGFATLSWDAMLVGVGVLVTMGDATIGSDLPSGSLANVVANASGAAIQVGDGTGSTFSGVTVARNTLGKNPGNGDPAPVGRGVDIRQPSSGTSVVENSIASAATAIRVAADAGGVSSTGNRFVANRFEGLTGIAIDLNGDGLRNPNDSGDGDIGPNGMLNHPTFTQALQSRIAGSVGASCAGCQVQVYVASHLPASPNDYGSTPLAGGTVVADAAGDFVLQNPPVTPGQWVIAVVTDAGGNTSEFGPAARVGAGIVQCGNPPLRPGWNLAGFFGPETATLGSGFPSTGGAGSKVAAIYHLGDGGAYTQWLAGAAAARTLDSLQVGEAYWFLASEPVTQAGGFSLTVPVPITLKAGWNEFVYIGATADARDALGSLAGKYAALYRWVNDSAGERWETFGAPDTPEWARRFTKVEACSVYVVQMSGDATLTPLQP